MGYESLISGSSLIPLQNGSVAYLGWGYYPYPLPTGDSLPQGEISVPSDVPATKNRTLEDSPTYGFEGIKTTVSVSTPVPIVYGKHLVGGNLIQAVQTPLKLLASVDGTVTTQVGDDNFDSASITSAMQNTKEVNGYLVMLLGLSEGLCRHEDGSFNFVDNILINGQDTDQYAGVVTIGLPGYADQTNQGLRNKHLDRLDLSEFIDDVMTAHDYTNETLTTAFITKTLTQNDTNIIRVGLIAPEGLMETTSEEDIKDVTVPIIIEMRKGADPFVQVNDFSTLVGTSSTGVLVTAETGTEATVPFRVIEANTKVNFRCIGNFGFNSWTTAPATLQYRLVGAGSWTTTQISWRVENSMLAYISVTASLAVGNYEMQFGFPNPADTYTAKSSNPLDSSSVQEDKAVTVVAVETISPTLATRTINFTGKTNAVLRREIHINTPVPGLYEVKIKRSTTPSVDANVKDIVQLDYINEVNLTDLGYANTAILVVGIRASEQSAGGVPDVKVLMYGKEVLNLITDEIEWSDNPAYILYDLLTNTRYGVGQYLTSAQIDIGSFQDAADYAEELVDDGTGNFEKRFKLDIVIDSQMSALELISRILITFRGYLVWSGGQIKLFVDKDDSVDPPAQSFDENTIIDKSFSYSLMSKSSLPNVIKVVFLDEANNYERTTLSVEDSDAINDGDPIVEKTIELFGVTRATQAHRQAKYFLNSARLKDLNISFATTTRSLNVEVGDLIEISHAMAGLNFQLFRVVNMGENQDGTTQIVAQKFDATVYGDATIEGETRPDETVEYLAPPVRDLVAIEKVSILVDGTAKSDMYVFYTPKRSYGHYKDFEIYLDKVETSTTVGA